MKKYVRKYLKNKSDEIFKKNETIAYLQFNLAYLNRGNKIFCGQKSIIKFEIKNKDD